LSAILKTIRLRSDSLESVASDRYRAEMTLGIKLNHHGVFTNFDYVEGNVTLDLKKPEDIESVSVMLEGLPIPIRF
jgi:hypothetical protein